MKGSTKPEVKALRAQQAEVLKALRANAPDPNARPIWATPKVEHEKKGE